MMSTEEDKILRAAVDQQLYPAGSAMANNRNLLKGGATTHISATISKLRRLDPKLNVHADPRTGSLKITFSSKGRNVTASMVFSLMAEDHPANQIALDEEMLSFEPEPGMVAKSKAPIWVVKSGRAGVVHITRV